MSMRGDDENEREMMRMRGRLGNRFRQIGNRSKRKRFSRMRKIKFSSIIITINSHSFTLISIIIITFILILNLTLLTLLHSPHSISSAISLVTSSHRQQNQVNQSQSIPFITSKISHEQQQYYQVQLQSPIAKSGSI